MKPKSKLRWVRSAVTGLAVGVLVTGCIVSRKTPEVMERSAQAEDVKPNAEPAITGAAMPTAPDQAAAEAAAVGSAKALEEIRMAAREVGQQLRFATNSAVIPKEARAGLQRLGEALKGVPTEKLKVKGFADSRGEKGWNQELSQERANAVKQILLDHGALAAQIEVEGYGETRPVATNTTQSGRAENRRVELEPYVGGPAG